MVYYIVFFFVILGEPVIVQDRNLTFSSVQECVDHGNGVIASVDLLVHSEPESAVTWVCLQREFNKLGNL